jgi:hypothetical protein
MCWVLVYVRKKDGLGKGRFDVFSGTSVSVTTCSDLENTTTKVRSCYRLNHYCKTDFVVERTVHSVLLSTAKIVNIFKS